MNQYTSDTSTAHSLDTAEHELKKIKEDKEKITETQEKASEARPNSSSEAEDSTGVNAAQVEPIDPRMPNMPPA